MRQDKKLKRGKQILRIATRFSCEPSVTAWLQERGGPRQGEGQRALRDPWPQYEICPSTICPVDGEISRFSTSRASPLMTHAGAATATRAAEPAKLAAAVPDVVRGGRLASRKRLPGQPLPKQPHDFRAVGEGIVAKRIFRRDSAGVDDRNLELSRG